MSDFLYIIQKSNTSINFSRAPIAFLHLGHFLPSAFMEPCIQISQKKWPHLVTIILKPSCFLTANTVRQIVHLGPLGLEGGGAAAAAKPVACFGDDVGDCDRGFLNSFFAELGRLFWRWCWWWRWWWWWFVGGWCLGGRWEGNGSIQSIASMMMGLSSSFDTTCLIISTSSSWGFSSSVIYIQSSIFHQNVRLLRITNIWLRGRLSWLKYERERRG